MLNTEWVHLKTSRHLTKTTRKELETALQHLNLKDTSIVVGGSLARGDYTTGSDIDSILLIDGPADPTHHVHFGKVHKVINSKSGKPVGPDGVFDTMVFSHELVHNIADQKDDNSNFIHRLFLLLESEAIGCKDAYNRVKRTILNTYLLGDPDLWSDTNNHVPRFLINEVFRFSKLISVSTMQKRLKRFGKGFAIRDIKLRMSRTMLCVSGVLACCCFHLDFSDDDRKTLFANANEKKKEEIIDHIAKVFEKTPLEIIAEMLLRYPHLNEEARKIMDSYDEFIGILADQDKRIELENLTEKDADKNKLYQELRKISARLEDGFLNLFSDQQNNLNNLILKYAVFGFSS